MRDREDRDRPILPRDHEDRIREKEERDRREKEKERDDRHIRDRRDDDRHIEKKDYDKDRYVLHWQKIAKSSEKKFTKYVLIFKYASFCLELSFTTRTFELFARLSSLSLLVAVTETIETGTGRRRKAVRARRRGASATTSPRRTAIGTSATRDARWRGRRAAERA